MKTWGHVVAGAIGGAAPDLALYLFGWRRLWVPETHPLVRLHRFMHSKEAVIWLFFVGYLTHVVIDWFSTHNTSQDHSV